jgi:serine/threonine protein kinase
LQEIAVIGRGSSGVVKKVLHKPSGGVYVLKVINFDMGCEQVRQQ